MKKPELLLIIEDLEQTQKLVTYNLNKLFIDKNISLEERWELYCRACETKVFHEEHYYSLDFKFMKDNNWEWYEDFCGDRYKTIYLHDLVDDILEHLWGEIGFDNESYTPIITDNEFQEIVEPRMDLIKEEILACGYASFIYDW
jgi:hypothetical protein